ncbi:MAG: hypothetical protein ACYSUX_05125 [Planctomycetota bacterium]|jgi:hypothetical protein
MEKEQIHELLNELGLRVTEPVRPGLGEEIKQRIPHRLSRHKIGWDTVNIIIDLRLSKSVAAAVIIVTMILLLNLFGSRDSTGGGIIKDGMLLINYWRNSGEDQVEISRSRYEHLLERGENVIWYGDSVDIKDANAVLMQFKLPDGKYELTFTDGREQQVDTEQLVKLLTRMLEKKKK